MAAETLTNQIASGEEISNNKTRAAESDPDMVNSSSGDDVAAKEGGELKSDTCPMVSEPVVVTNVQKKMRRAERFGMPVKLSEEEKRNTRAERFGTKPSSPGTDAVKSAEELKRKARADRFGIPEQPVADNESKKKTRLAKFTPAAKNDPVEEDKRKARAARFSQVKVSSVSHANGEGNIEPKAAIVGKAGGGP